MTTVFKPYKPKNVPKGMGGFHAQVEGQLKKQMGPAKPGKKLRF